MFWKKKFKAIEEQIEAVRNNVLSVERDAKKDILKSGNFIRKEFSRTLDDIRKDDIDWKTSQDGINQHFLNDIKKLIESNNLFNKQVAALIETHPNKDMYLGVFNRPETKKK